MSQARKRHKHVVGQIPHPLQFSKSLVAHLKFVNLLLDGDKDGSAGYSGKEEVLRKPALTGDDRSE